MRSRTKQKVKLFFSILVIACSNDIVAAGGNGKNFKETGRERRKLW